MPESPFAASSPPALAGHDSALASAALGRLAGIFAEDAIFVLGSGVREAKDALDGMLQRRGPAYAAALQGQPHARMTAGFDAWYVEMVRALASVSPPASIPMMGVVREGVTLELGARGLRSLFSSKPSEKDVARVKRYGSLAVRTLRAVLASDGTLDADEYRAVGAVVAALGLPEADASALRAEPAIAADALDVRLDAQADMDHTVARAIVRGAWLAAAADEIDPREEAVIRVVGRKMGIAPEDVEDARRFCVCRPEWGGRLHRLAPQGGRRGDRRHPLRALRPGPRAGRPARGADGHHHASTPVAGRVAGARGARRAGDAREATPGSRGGRPARGARRGVGRGAGRRPERGAARGALRPVGAIRRRPRGGRPAAPRDGRAMDDGGSGGSGEDAAMKTRRLGFLGAGNMSGALIKGLLHAKVLPPERILASDVKADRLEQLHKLHGIRTTTDNHALLRESDVVVLAVKPQAIDKVLTEVGAELRSDQLVVSVAAGVPIDALEARLPAGVRVVRAMPNTPATVQAGATAIAGGAHAREDDLRIARELFEAVGRVVVLDEGLIDAVTGLSGSGPAYVMLIIEALADGGVKVGLHRDTALLLAAQTVFGSALLLLETGEHPGRLKDMVTSPGGTAIAGLHTLESGALRKTLIDAVEVASKRAAELGAEMSAKLRARLK
jgi:pyrroline-5-carboxylate reductase